MIVISVVAGVFLGALGCAINFFLLKASIKKGDANAVTGGSMLRLVVDGAMLSLAFLAGRYLPVDYTAILIAAAVTLSLGGTLSALLLMKKH